MSSSLFAFKVMDVFVATRTFGQQTDRPPNGIFMCIVYMGKRDIT